MQQYGKLPSPYIPKNQIGILNRIAIIFMNQCGEFKHFSTVDSVHRFTIVINETNRG